MKVVLILLVVACFAAMTYGQSGFEAMMLANLMNNNNRGSSRSSSAGGYGSSRGSSSSSATRRLPPGFLRNVIGGGGSGNRGMASLAIASAFGGDGMRDMMMLSMCQRNMMMCILMNGGTPFGM